MSNIDDIKETTQVSDEVVEVPQTFKLADESEYEIEDDNDEVIEEVVVEVPKKKFPLQSTIVVALCLVLGTLITYLALLFLIPSVEGTWYYETQDGYKIYYTLEERDDECYFEIAYGTAVYPGSYQFNPNGKDNTLVFSTKYNECALAQYAGQLLFLDCLHGEYTYTISGNKLFGECTLSLDDGSGTPIVMKYVEKPQLTDYVKPYKDFKVNKSLLGTWELDNSMYGMDPTVVTFNEDGSMKIDNSGLYTVNYMYSPVDNIIKMTGFANEKVEQEAEFELKDGSLIFNDIMLTRPGETPDYSNMIQNETSHSTKDQSQ